MVRFGEVDEVCGENMNASVPIKFTKVIEQILRKVLYDFFFTQMAQMFID